MTQFSSTIVALETIATDTIEVHFSRPADFTFAAGQFVQWLIPDEDSFVPRSYSIASHPTAETLCFAVKLLPNGIASTWLSQAKVGDEMTMRGPLGHFVQKEADKSALYVATGTGLAPIKGIIEDELINKQNKAPLKLLFGVRHEEHVFWEEIFATLAKTYDNFSYAICLSQPKEDSTCLHGRVTVHVADQAAYDEYFLCGSGPMVKEVRQMLLDKEVDLKQMHFEIF